VNGTDSDSCPIVGFVIIYVVERSGLATTGIVRLHYSIGLPERKIRNNLKKVTLQLK
jgi:hypothetical protein